MIAKPFVRRIFVGLLLAALSTLVCVVAGEVALHLFAPQPVRYIQLPEGLFIEDVQLGWRHRPNLDGTMRHGRRRMDVRTDALGLRVTPHVAPATAESILFVGDSFTFGLGVEAGETFVAQVEAQSPGVAPRCRNAGVCAYALPQYVRALRPFSSDVRPATAVVCLYPENDLNTAWVDGPWIEADRPGWRGTAGGLVYSNSHLYRLVKESLQPGAPAEMFVYMLRPYRTQPDVQEAIRHHVRESVNAMVADCRKQGIDLRLVILPSLLQAHADSLATAARRGSVNPADYDIRAPHQVIVQEAQRAGVPCLDLLEAFNSHLQPASLYIPLDRHFTAEGHALAAKQIAAWLARNSQHGI